jgi:hypothetical protein
LIFGICSFSILIINYVETIPYIILISALIETPISIPIKTDAILFIICPGAFVNSPVSPSELSYSMSLTLVPAAVIFVPISPTVDARPILQAILRVSLVDSSALNFEHSLAMR